MLYGHYNMTYNWNIIVVYVLMYSGTPCVASWYDIPTPSITEIILLVPRIKYSTWHFWDVKIVVNNLN